MCGVNAREDKPGDDRFAGGAVAEGHGLCGVCAEPADQLADRFRRSVWLRPPGRATVLALAGWHRESGAVLEHRGIRADRQHVLAPGLIETVAQTGVPAIGSKKIFFKNFMDARVNYVILEED